jgi:hypothetical protein
MFNRWQGRITSSNLYPLHPHSSWAVRVLQWIRSSHLWCQGSPKDLNLAGRIFFHAVGKSPFKIFFSKVIFKLYFWTYLKNIWSSHLKKVSSLFQKEKILYHLLIRQTGLAHPCQVSSWALVSLWDHLKPLRLRQSAMIQKQKNLWHVNFMSMIRINDKHNKLQ